MTKKILILGVLFWVMGCQKENPLTPGDQAQHYLPLASGNLWMYDKTFSQSENDTTVSFPVQLIGPFTQNGLPWYGVNEECVSPLMNPLPTICAEWARESNKVLARRDAGPGYSSPETILDLPLLNGKEWINKSVDSSWYTPAGGGHIVQQIKRVVRGMDNITIPAGTFKDCFHLQDNTLYVYETWFESRATTDTTLTMTDEWYAFDVGMVKQMVVSMHSGNTIPTVVARQSYVLRQFSVKLND